MNVIVDGEANFRLDGEPKDVLAVVGAVTSFLQEKGRAILSLKVDGEAIPPAELVERLEDTPLEDAGTLEVESAEVGALVRECLGDVQASIPELPKACHELAQIFQGESPEDGFEPFQRLAELWGVVKSREQMAASALALSLDKLKIDHKPFDELHEELNQYLTEAAAALEANDCVLLGDLLEYELAPRAEMEAQILALLLEQVPDPPA